MLKFILKRLIILIPRTDWRFIPCVQYSEHHACRCCVYPARYGSNTGGN